ncbi:Hydroxyethylthiazole kinase family-domain-containing protein [Kalaharituber pfeilii]|nr:Hydroxyethylthiazole kinase family-domain-containing protein [Kalaharituber pfeilii]
MSLPPLDLTLYLVTSSDLLPSNTTLAKHVEAAIKGGVSIVQLREKEAPTREFVKLGREVHAVTKKYKVPLLINDRVDVAVAVGCEGVHLGQDDMDYKTARKLLGPSTYIGISANNTSEALKALQDISEANSPPNSTYLGLGPVFATPTKPDHNPPLGTEGIRDILQTLTKEKLARPLNFPDTKFVAIGGINKRNVHDVLYKGQPSSDFKQASAPELLELSGVAVVSAIMASPTPELAASDLRQQITLAFNPHSIKPIPVPEITSQQSYDIIKSIPKLAPLIHHITNAVVKDISANITLAIGASPIMSDNSLELTDLAAINSALVVNMGTCVPEFEIIAEKAIIENNKHGNPIVFDPVGAGATEWRRNLSKKLLRKGYLDVVKGNRGEILTIAGEDVVMRGVDSGSWGERIGLKELAKVVRDLARREENVVLMTGQTDIISNGIHTFLLQNGHPIQSKVTGIGCALSSVIAATLSVARRTTPGVKLSSDAKLSAIIAAVTMYNVAAERAAKRAKGPGSWRVAFLDMLEEVVSCGVGSEEVKVEKVGLEG